MIYIEVTETIFRDQFYKMDRGKQFSYAAMTELYDFILEASLGSDIELDVIALCCDFSEDNLEDVLNNYELDSLEELQNQTWAVMLDDDTVLYQIF